MLKAALLESLPILLNHEVVSSTMRDSIQAHNRPSDIANTGRLSSWIARVVDPAQTLSRDNCDAILRHYSQMLAVSVRLLVLYFSIKAVIDENLGYASDAPTAFSMSRGVNIESSEDLQYFAATV